MKYDRVPFKKSDVEVRCIKNLSEFLLHAAKNFLLIQARADCLPNLREQLVFFGAALRIVHDDVVLQREADLESEADEQA